MARGGRVSWAPLGEEISRWRDAGRKVEFWWRDDDATAPTAAVRKLLQLSKETRVPLALAVVPLGAQAQLFDDFEAQALMHGTDHRNRAASGAKKTEFPEGEPDDAVLERLARARTYLEALAGAAFVPVLAPPWNRFRRELLPALAASGWRGFSAYGPRDAVRPAGITQVNTHVDIIDWRGTRAFCGEEAAL